MDRAINELQLEPEQMYQLFVNIIAEVNKLIGTYHNEELGDWHVSPESNTVAFAAGKQGWAFRLKDFARIYAKKFNVKEDKMISKLWGDNYYDPSIKKWTTSPISSDGKTKLKRGFCQFILEPIIQMFENCKKETMEKFEKQLKIIGVALKNEELQKEPKEVLKLAMQRWLPLADTILEMIATKLPSPAEVI
jgi:elongation factor 2